MKALYIEKSYRIGIYEMQIKKYGEGKEDITIWNREDDDIVCTYSSAQEALTYANALLKVLEVEKDLLEINI